ncbi:MAG TPA: DUF885 domain-containing protein [Chitinophagaceae bacterium]|nr:DUF885 domain-containing protein [Chitinophagaceae bacterium]
MYRIIAYVMLFVVIVSCKNNDKKSSSGTADSDYQTIADDFLKGYLDWRPQSAINLGLHEYDGKLTDYSKASLDNELKRLKDFEQKLAALDTTKLSSKMFYDYRILRSAIMNEILGFEGTRDFYNNPMEYAGAIDVNVYVKRNYAPLEDRLKSIIAAEAMLPAIYEAAKQNLDESLPKPYIETAIDIAGGNASFMGGDLIVALKDVKDDSLMAKFRRGNDAAIASINGFIDWLKKDKMPKANHNYAIGEENYKKMLLYGEDIVMSPEKILETGLAELKKEQDRFNEAAKIIDPNKKPIDVYHEVQRDHPTADSLIPEAKEHLEIIRQFLVDHQIVTIPSEVRVQVKETPQYARSTSTASMDTPGPFEKSTEAYYYITPVDPKWTAKQKEDWLTQFDYFTTDNVTVHEAYPGHYTQFLHINASDATRVQKIFGSYAFMEGWAHYCEKMMIDEGWGNTGDPVKAAKYRITQSGDALLRICRLCVSVKMHCQGMTLEEGTKFFMDNWYQGEKPSYQEALRGTFDPGYLFYTVGKLEIFKLREEYRQQEGSNFSLKRFHDQVLDHGMPPLRLIRELLLKDKTKWDEIL